jgi:hypothetical protein
MTLLGLLMETITTTMECFLIFAMFLWNEYGNRLTNKTISRTSTSFMDF